MLTVFHVHIYARARERKQGERNKMWKAHFHKTNRILIIYTKRIHTLMILAGKMGLLCVRRRCVRIHCTRHKSGKWNRFSCFSSSSFVRTRNRIQGINHEICTGFWLHLAMLEIKDYGKLSISTGKVSHFMWLCAAASLHVATDVGRSQASNDGKKTAEVAYSTLDVNIKLQSVVSVTLQIIGRACKFNFGRTNSEKRKTKIWTEPAVSMAISIAH